MRKQRYFERTISGHNWKEDETEFYWLLKTGWKIILAIPIQSGKSCHTYTSAIHYILEKEAEEDE